MNSEIMTIGGTFFDPLAPEPRAVNPSTIAHALERIVRFNGHTRRTITVAEHSLRVRRIVARLGGDRTAQLLGLLHDSAEAYVGDIVRPIKKNAAMVRTWTENELEYHSNTPVSEVEDKVLDAILSAVSELFDLGPVDWSSRWPVVREADEIALFFEAMLEQPRAEIWAPGLLASKPQGNLAIWAFLPDIAPRPGESWLEELGRVAGGIRS